MLPGANAGNVCGVLRESRERRTEESWFDGATDKEVSSHVELNITNLYKKSDVVAVKGNHRRRIKCHTNNLVSILIVQFYGNKNDGPHYALKNVGLIAASSWVADAGNAIRNINNRINNTLAGFEDLERKLVTFNMCISDAPLVFIQDLDFRDVSYIMYIIHYTTFFLFNQFGGGTPPWLQLCTERKECRSFHHLPEWGVMAPPRPAAPPIY